MADILNKLNSANYVTVKVTDNAITNGNNLLAAYALAKTTLPNGAALSTVNRLAVILPAAIYDLGTQSLILDTQYIDIIGSTSDREKHHIKNNIGAVNRGTVQQTANDVKLYNLTIENSNTTYIRGGDNTDPAAYFPNSSLPLTYIENAKFLSNNVFSMRIATDYSGTYINCTAGDYSFGGESGSLSGIFTNCTGGNFSFAGSGSFPTSNYGGTLTSTSIFINCTGGNFSFAGSSNGGGTISGTLKDCTGGDNSFAGSSNVGGTISSTAVLENCRGGDNSFAGSSNGGGTINGTLTSCTGGGYSFAGGFYGGTISGTLTNCIGGNSSFAGSSNGSGTINGTLTSCTGGDNSFAGSSNVGGTINGTLTSCTGGGYSFAGGFFGGTISGTLTNCTGGDYSFAGGLIGGAISGILKDCFGGIGSFNL